VGNGWYFRELAEVLFWRQANGLVTGEKVRETAWRREPSFTGAKLFWWFDLAHADGGRVIVLSEYGITPVSGAVHPNCVLREAPAGERGTRPRAAGCGRVRGLRGGRPPGGARVRPRPATGWPRSRPCSSARRASSALDEGQRASGLHHPRSGELVAVSAADRWFTYHYWLDDARAPDFAPTVDIISSEPELVPSPDVAAGDVKALILDHLFR
jgi:hypothetical protein